MGASSLSLSVNGCRSGAQPVKRFVVSTPPADRARDRAEHDRPPRAGPDAEITPRNALSARSAPAACRRRTAPAAIATSPDGVVRRAERIGCGATRDPGAASRGGRW